MFGLLRSASAACRQKMAAASLSQHQHQIWASSQIRSASLLSESQRWSASSRNSINITPASVTTTIIRTFAVRWTKAKKRRRAREVRRAEWARIGKPVPKPPRWKDPKTPVINAVPREEQERIRLERRKNAHLTIPKPPENPNIPKDIPRLLLPFHNSVHETQASLKISPRVAKLLALTNGNQKRVVQAQKHAGMKLFQKRPGDTGSSSVQVIALTSRIQAMQTHLLLHPKDTYGKRRLTMLIVKRRKMLDYLERKDFNEYAKVAQTLGLA